jgi:hypothetical protein
MSHTSHLNKLGLFIWFAETVIKSGQEIPYLFKSIFVSIHNHEAMNTSA